MTFTYLFIGLVALYAALAAVIDSRLHRVPNWLTVPTALLGLVFHSFAPAGWGASTAIGGFAVGFALLLLPTLMGGAGFGDVKLLAGPGCVARSEIPVVGIYADHAHRCDTRAGHHRRDGDSRGNVDRPESVCRESSIA